MSVVTSVRDTASSLSSLQKNHMVMYETSGVFQTWAPQMKGLRLVLVPGSSCVRLGITLVLVLSFLPSLYCDLGSAFHSSFEIVIPKALTVEGREEPVEKASYVIFMQGQKQLIHLKVKRDYFISNFPVFSYHNGILGQEIPLISHDCHYEGYIGGVPGSFVSVNTCSGLRGILIKEGISYGIKPIDSSERFEHVLYTMAHQAQVSCNVTSKDSQVVSTSRQQGSRKPGGLQALSYLRSHTKYVEMFVVVNNQRFQMWSSNVNETVQRVMDIIALANSFTREINTEVVLAGMEIWTEGDLIEVPVDLQVTLRNFNSWRQQQLLHRVKHDVAHMIVGQHPEQGMGQAFLSGACSSGFAAAVESFHHEDVLLFAALMVHELGHNLGIQHDHSACICKGKHPCLMYENVTKESGFSNCSSDYFYQFLQEHRGACLFNNPQHVGRLRRNDRCGNGVIDRNEQCDCGAICDNSPCCNPNCTFKGNAKCTGGLCCTDSCQFEPEGIKCRHAKGECDLPEYCTGTSGKCPENRYKQDGTPCDSYYCVKGVCRNPNYQCRDTFGESSQSASSVCYKLINSKGNQFGNCGHSSKSGSPYIQCDTENVMCGKIICTNVKFVPKLNINYSVIQIPHEDGFCWSINNLNTKGTSSSEDVHYGTTCGPNKICKNNACTDYAVLKYDCDPKIMCNSRGICNDLKHCHCTHGYAPPDCKQDGPGGSVDSGTPGGPDNEGGSSGTTKPPKIENYIDRIILGFLMLFFVILAVITMMCLIFRTVKAEAAEEAEISPEEEEAEEEGEEEEVEEEEEEEEEPEE